jgi:hypothetical protein
LHTILLLANDWFYISLLTKDKAMKKTLVLFSLVLGSLSLSAQYFTREYGTTASGDRLTDGGPTANGPAGHLLTGTTNIASTSDIALVRTDAAGATPGFPTFRNYYRLVNSANAVLTATPVKVIQMPTGNIFVAGSYTGSAATDKGVFTAIFNAAGTVVSVKGWKTTNTATTSINAVSACQSNLTGNETVYVTGSVDLTPYNTSLGSGVFVLAVNGSTNALVWSQTYTFSALSGETAADIIASPYNNNNELVVAGNYQNGSDKGAFLMRVNRTTSFPISANTYNYTTTNETVLGICVAPHPVAVNEGFALCGTTNPNSALNRIWVFRVNANCNTVVNNAVIAYSNSTSAVTGADIISRTNTMGNVEFYASGTAVSGQLGQNDMVVVKLTSTLGFAGEYTYGTAATSESNQEIAGFADGFGVYGNIRISNLAGNGDMYVAKAYYNGVTQCNSANNTSTITTPALTTATTPAADVKDLAMPVVSLSPLSTLGLFTHCNAVAVAGGSNARLISQQEEPAGVALLMYPNPISVSDAQLTLQFTSPGTQQIEIRITDMLGRVVMNKQMDVLEGLVSTQIQLPSGLAEGVYNLQLTGDGISETQRFIVK